MTCFIFVSFLLPEIIKQSNNLTRPSGRMRCLLCMARPGVFSTTQSYICWCLSLVLVHCHYRDAVCGSIFWAFCTSRVFFVSTYRVCVGERHVCSDGDGDRAGFRFFVKTVISLSCPDLCVEFLFAQLVCCITKPRNNSNPQYTHYP